MTSPSLSGVLVVDKPAGPTSHDVVDRVRAVLGLRRVGHTGTLDPFATGVLPVCVGKATRLASLLAQDTKLYRARVRFGFSTTTDDLTGQALSSPCPVDLARLDLAAACQALTGPLMQTPPCFSAKRIAGRRSHELARQGAPVAPRAVPVTVHSIEILSVDKDQAEIEARCSSGTYVRALARDLGQRLGVGGHLTALRRLASGPFTCDQAASWERLESEAGQRLLPLSALLLEWPSVCVGAQGLLALSHGRDLAPDMLLGAFPQRPPSGLLRVLDQEGRLVALGSVRGLPYPSAAPPTAPSLHPDIVLL